LLIYNSSTINAILSGLREKKGQAKLVLYLENMGTFSTQFRYIGIQAILNGIKKNDGGR
jgi:hypothetical protein